MECLEGALMAEEDDDFDDDYDFDICEFRGRCVLILSGGHVAGYRVVQGV